MKNVIAGIRGFLKIAFPRSRWGNVIYLILGLILAQWEAFIQILEALRNIF